MGWGLVGKGVVLSLDSTHALWCWLGKGQDGLVWGDDGDG